MSSDQQWDRDERRRGVPPPPGRPTPVPLASPAPRYSLADLERETRTSGRTIRYYISEGLLPPAYGRGPSATYDLGHLLRLRLIASLKENRLGLQEIRDRLNGLTDDDIAAMLNVQTEPVEEFWRRIELHPDIELHVRQRSRSDPAMDDAVDLIVGLTRPVIERLDERRS
ncbi:MAG: MerR family transcriptional regulator [Thermomicrobiales bacterium]|nr:MerR family transcriptional regulator [Thermomicrobiales bacterium]MCO5221973.1 helix-turn-helix domain-containing protein [Thermomicrobiales bacterium]